MSDRIVTNPSTGEQVEFVSNEPEQLTMLVTWPRHGHRVAEHLHPRMEETWTVLEGHAGFVIDGDRIDAEPGDVVRAAPGLRHRAWNAGGGPVRVRIEMRPALRWEEFVRRHFDGENILSLVNEFRDEIALPPPAGHERRTDRSFGV